MDKTRLLIVDDEPTMTKMLKRNLEAGGKYEVRTENERLQAELAALRAELGKTKAKKPRKPR